MNSSGKMVIVVVIIVVVIAIAAYFMHGTNQASAPPVASSVPVTGTDVPTVSFLKSHPDALSKAQERCDSGNGQEVVSLCDAVHSAKASLMADKFRQGVSGGAK